MSPTTLVVIPARWGSVRLPGKPLVRIAGHTLLERSIALARRGLLGFPDACLVVATDDSRVADHAQAQGCETVMTPASLTSGSARTLAAARSLVSAGSAIVSLQGDAPFLPPSVIRIVATAILDGRAVCATPVVQLDWAALDRLRAHKAVTPFSGTTCIRAEDGRAIWFSKQIIPALRDENNMRARQRLSPVLRHLGLYGFDLETLEQFEHLSHSSYEKIEGLEQLRLLEAGISIQACLVTEPQRIPMGGIDTIEDVLLAEQLIERHGDPFDE